MDVLKNIPDTKQRLLVHEASRWIGIREQGGNNRGQCVELFQRAVDGKASGEPWCLSFVQFCLGQVDDTFDAMLGTCNAPTNLFKTEHCWTLWNKTQAGQRIYIPEAGLLALWNYKGTRNGHVGIVSGLLESNLFYSIEGNTRDSAGIEREGDGVYEKIRPLESVGRMDLLGFLRPWE